MLSKKLIAAALVSALGLWYRLRRRATLTIATIVEAATPRCRATAIFATAITCVTRIIGTTLIAAFAEPGA